MSPLCPTQRQAWLLEQFRLVYTVGYSVSLVSLLLALLLLLLFRYGTPRGHPWVLRGAYMCCGVPTGLSAAGAPIGVVEHPWVLWGAYMCCGVPTGLSAARAPIGGTGHLRVLWGTYGAERYVSTHR